MGILAFNKPTVKNCIAEAGLFLMAGVSIYLYNFSFKDSVPLWQYLLIWGVNAGIGFIIEYKTEKWYDYDHPLITCGGKDVSPTFALAYGGGFSILHLYSLSLIEIWQIPVWAGWFFPNAILALLIFGGNDSFYYNVLKYYKFNDCFYKEIVDYFKIVRIPLMKKTVPPWNLPFGVLVTGYGMTFGIILYNLNNLLIRIIESLI